MSKTRLAFIVGAILVFWLWQKSGESWEASRFAEGFAAQQAGVSAEANPELSSAGRRLWLKGWMSAK